VRLREVYSISKSIALKKGLVGVDPVVSSHSDAGKIIRKVNVKMGIRIIEETPLKEITGRYSISQSILGGQRERIRMTAIFFGV
jgi:hypothetical protein